MHYSRFRIPLLLLLTIATACSPFASNAPQAIPLALAGFSSHFSTVPIESKLCPQPLDQIPTCFTPYALRLAYGVEPLTAQGYTGTGQTVLIVAFYYSSVLQQDLDIFDQQFGLPPITPQVVSLGSIPAFDPNNSFIIQSSQEVELDIEMVHAFAPGAAIDVLVSTGGTGAAGFGGILSVEQYAVDHHLGQIITASLGYSEALLSGNQTVQAYDSFFQQATLQQHITFLAATGDNGAVIRASDRVATVGFPASDPWVTAVGGTTLESTGQGYNEIGWSGSGGGMSALFAEPAYQQRYLPSQLQTQLNGQRGLPDVAADADPQTSMACYVLENWIQCGGTSASTPLWAAIIAIANQVAGSPLGFINPRLYTLGVANQGDFRDITSGSNGVHTGVVDITGFQAAPGWDAVTGWGAPQAYQLIGDLIAAPAS